MPIFIEINFFNMYFHLQLLGIEDLHVFNGGSVHVEPTTLLGNGTSPGEIIMNSLHVQNKGYFQVKTADSENDVSMKLHNISVSLSNNFLNSFISCSRNCNFIICHSIFAVLMNLNEV